MPHIRLTVQYDGTRYCGWQKQGNTEKTVQQRIERALCEVTGESVHIDGAGRTDAGVHAAGQVASFSMDRVMPLDALMSQTNKVLPKDICITSAREAPEGFHARLWAVGKVYEYRIWNRPAHNVFAASSSWHVPEPLDLACMRRAAQALTGTHDFSAFTAYTGNKTKVRRIDEIVVEDRDGFVIIRFSADGFLYKMIRIMVGTLVAAGSGERFDIAAILAGKSRMGAGITAPPQGLCLMRVQYKNEK